MASGGRAIHRARSVEFSFLILDWGEGWTLLGALDSIEPGL